MTYGSDMSFPFYTDLDGSALEGSIWIGAAGQNPVTNPVTVYWDSAGTQPAAQPVTISKGRTVRSDGTPNRVWVASDFSALVQNKLGAQVLFEPNQPLTIAALNAINQATAQVALAAAQVVLTTNQANAAAGSATTAAGYALAAQTAQGAAFGIAQTYPDTATALADGTLAVGKYFGVISASNAEVVIVYLKAAGSVATDTGKRIVNANMFSALAGANAYQVGTDGSNQVIWYSDDSGIWVVVSGTPVLLSGYPAELIKQTGVTSSLTGSEDARGMPLAAIDSSGRLQLNDLGDVFAKVASSDVAMGRRYDQFGDTAGRAYYLADKGENLLKQRVRIEKTVCRWDEDAGVNFCRMPSILMLTSTTGLIFFSQRGSSFGNNNGEAGQRAVCRSFTVDYTAGSISVGATVVINQPAQWNVQNPNGGWVLNGTAFVEGASGAHPGRIHCYMNTLTSANFRPNDAIRTYRIIEQHSDDNGATWSAAVDFYTVNNVFNGVSGLTTGLPGNPPGTPSQGLGPLLGTGNCLLRLTQGAHAGRLVMVLNVVPGDGTVDWWQGCIYSDNEGATWTQGQFYHQPTQRQSEVQAVELTDGRILMQTRVEQNDGVTQVLERGQYRSVNVGDPSSFTYEGYNTSCVISDNSACMLNASYAAANGFGKVIVGGTGNNRYGARDKQRFVLSYDKGVTFIASCALFPDAAGVGYSYLSAIPGKPGFYAFAYEVFNGVDAINIEDSVRLLIFNDAELFNNSSLL